MNINNIANSFTFLTVSSDSCSIRCFRHVDKALQTNLAELISALISLFNDAWYINIIWNCLKRLKSWNIYQEIFLLNLLFTWNALNKRLKRDISKIKEWKNVSHLQELNSCKEHWDWMRLCIFHSHQLYFCKEQRLIWTSTSVIVQENKSKHWW